MTYSKRVSSHSVLVITSQVCNNLTNLLVALAVARVTTPVEFGLWAILYALYALGLQVLRSVVSTPMLIDDSVHKTVPSQLATQTVSAGLLISAVWALIVSLIALALPSAGQQLGLLLALALPLLLTQDVCRYLAIRNHTGGQAALLDITWLAMLGIFYPLLHASHHADLITLTMAWAVGGSVGTLLWILLNGALPTPRKALTFLRCNRHQSPKLLLEAVLGVGARQSLPMILALVANLSVSGGIRAAQTAFGPITVLIMSLAPLITTRTVLLSRRGMDNRNVIFAFSWVVLGISVMTTALFLYTPDHIGRVLLGQNWSPVLSIAIPMGLATAMRGPASVVPMVLLGRRQIDQVVALRIRTIGPNLAFPAIGAYSYGLSGAAWGIALASLVNAIQSLQAARQ